MRQGTVDVHGGLLEGTQIGQVWADRRVHRRDLVPVAAPGRDRGLLHGTTQHQPGVGQAAGLLAGLLERPLGGLAAVELERGQGAGDRHPGQSLEIMLRAGRRFGTREQAPGSAIVPDPVGGDRLAPKLLRCGPQAPSGVRSRAPG